MEPLYHYLDDEFVEEDGIDLPDLGGEIEDMPLAVQDIIKVCIDPGHGGTDRANRGPTGFIEADGNLEIAKLLKKELESTGRFLVKLTREKDVYLTFLERARIAAQYGANLFLSQHSNAMGAGNTTAGGTEVWSSVTRDDGAFAALLSTTVAEALGIKDRGAFKRPHPTIPKEDYYAVLKYAHRLGIPHELIVESAFHSNPKEEAILKSPAGQLKIAKAEATAICEYYGVPYGTKLPTPVILGVTATKPSLTVGQATDIVGAGLNCHHIGLFVNGKFVTSSIGNGFRYTWKPTKAGTYTIQLKGRNTAMDTEEGTKLAESKTITVRVGV